MLDLHFVNFVGIGLSDTSSDRVVWRHAQAHRMLLVTGNRNMSGTDSLEQTIREENSPTMLPILTVGVIERLRDKMYRENCTERLAEIVFDLDQHLGAGRLFIP